MNRPSAEWHEIPAAPPGKALQPVLGFLAAWIIATAGPLALAVRTSLAALVVVPVVGASALLVSSTRWARHWSLRLGIAAAASAAVSLVLGELTALWLGGGLLLAVWVAFDRPPLPFLGRPGPGSLVPTLALCVLTAMLVEGRGLTPPLAGILVLAALVPLATKVRGGEVGRAASRATSLLGRGVSSALCGLTGSAVVVLPWAVQRVLRLDPLGSATGWIPRVRRGARAARWWSRPARHPRSAGEQARRAAVAVVAVCPAAAVLVAAAISYDLPARIERVPFLLIDDNLISEELPAGVTIRDPVEPGVEAVEVGPDNQPAAMEGVTWFHDPRYHAAQGWTFEPSVAWRSVNWYNMLDFETTYVNQLGGTRRTWTPPACRCPRVRVWMYGGSTAYGLGQRDDYTIASQLAKVAHEHGVTLDVENRGGYGHLHWIEAERFAWDLTIDDPPDLVVFYDGVNDMWAGNTLNHRGGGDTKSFVNPTTFDLWWSSERSSGPIPDGPPGSRFEPPADVHLNQGVAERVIIERYDRSRTLSKRQAAAHGVMARYFWQPSRFSRPLVEREPHSDTDMENRSRLSEAVARWHLPDDVIDVTDALRGTTEPLFTDDVHHNELGARMIAESMFERLERDLLDLREHEDASR